MKRSLDALFLDILIITSPYDELLVNYFLMIWHLFHVLLFIINLHKEYCVFNIRLSQNLMPNSFVLFVETYLQFLWREKVFKFVYYHTPVSILILETEPESVFVAKFGRRTQFRFTIYPLSGPVQNISQMHIR